MKRFLNNNHIIPEICNIQFPIKMIGTPIRTQDKRIYRDVDKLFKIFNTMRTATPIPNKKEPWAFVAISRAFKDDGSWEYLIGDVVNDLTLVPEGWTAREIPAGYYAKFIIQPKFNFLWGLVIGMMKRYIYTEWLPASAYDISGQDIAEFEYHDERSVGKKPMIELYVSIKQKSE